MILSIQTLRNVVEKDVLILKKRKTIFYLNVFLFFEFSDQYIGSFIKYDMMRVIEPFLQEALLVCGENPRLGSQFVEVGGFLLFKTVEKNFKSSENSNSFFSSSHI